MHAWLGSASVCLSVRPTALPCSGSCLSVDSPVWLADLDDLSVRLMSRQALVLPCSGKLLALGGFSNAEDSHGGSSSAALFDASGTACAVYTPGTAYHCPNLGEWG
jgi:hypothetical protein